jgi:hypothetical protein
MNMYRAAQRAIKNANNPVRQTAQTAQLVREAERRAYGMAPVKRTKMHPLARLNVT